MPYLYTGGMTLRRALIPLLCLTFLAGAITDRLHLPHRLRQWREHRVTSKPQFASAKTVTTLNPMSAFSNDAFEDANGTDLFAHTSDSGGTWAKVSGNTGAILIQSNSASDATTGAPAAYYLSGAPVSADYDVQADLTFLNSPNGDIGVIGRASSTANTFYWGIWEGNPGQWSLNKVVAGSVTNLAHSADTTLTNGQKYTLKLSLRGTTLTLYVNGVSTVTAADSSISAAGYAGISLYNSASGETARINNFSASNPASAQAIYADNAAWRLSPYNHHVTGSGAGAVDTTVNTGAYWRIYEVGSTTAVLNFATAPASAYVAYRWNGGAWTRVPVATTITLANIPTAPTVQHLLEFCYAACSTTTDRWSNSPPTNAIQFTGLTLDPGITVAQPPARPKNVLIYGDSIKEGARVLSANAGYPSTDNDATLSAYFGLQDALNAEVGLVAFSGQGIVVTTNSASENVPNLASTYAYLYAGVARAFSPQPDLCIIDEGENDSGASSTTAQASLVTVAQGAGAKKTLIMGDESGYQTAACQAAVAQLGVTALYGVPAAGLAAGASVSGATVDSYDGVHPTAAAHKTKLLPAVAAPAYQLLYGAGTTTGGGGFFF